jgi:hypothetical protein
MNVNLQIDRLILHNIDLSPSQRADLQAIVTAELTQLFSTQGVPPQWQRGGAIAALPAGPIAVATGSDPQHLGQQIAQQIYGQLSQ